MQVLGAGLGVLKKKSLAGFKRGSPAEKTDHFVMSKPFDSVI